MPIGGFSGLMVVGGQHDDGGCSSNSSLTFSYKCFVNIRSFILVIVRQYITFNNDNILVRNLFFFNTKMVGMLKDTKKRKM